jgi:type IV secretion system protein VirD4
MICLPNSSDEVPYPIETQLIQLGYVREKRRPIGFQSNLSSKPGLREFDSELPLVTIAPTGRGKGVSALVPNLLTNNRPMIVLDPKGELFAITARRRRELGQSVYVLDPFNVMTKKSDSLNPLDLLKMNKVDAEVESQVLAEAIGHDFQSKREAFWDQHSLGIISGLISYTAMPGRKNSLAEVRDHLVGEDPIAAIAATADRLAEMNEQNSLAFRELVALLNQSERDTRPSVLASAGAYMKIFNCNQVLRSVEKSSFKLSDLVAGKPMTIYMILPANKLTSHRALLRLWLATMVSVFLSRSVRPAESTLLMIDECGQLGTFDLLKSVVTLCRGFGVQPWMFFQSLYQLKECYGESWRLFIDNMGAVQVFGIANMFGAAEWGDFFGRRPKDLLNIPLDEQLLYITGQGTVEASRLNYLRDQQYEGLFDPNPYYVRSKTENYRKGGSDR